jgi:hypothetical protein
MIASQLKRLLIPPLSGHCNRKNEPAQTLGVNSKREAPSYEHFSLTGTAVTCVNALVGHLKVTGGITKIFSWNAYPDRRLLSARSEE